MQMDQIIQGLSRPVLGRVKLDERAGLSVRPGLALRRGCTHEVTGPGRDGFLAAFAGASHGPVIWIGLGRDVRAINPLGLYGLLDPSRIVTVEGLTRQEILWAGEQALRTRGPGCVVMELALGPDLSESRRLQLAAETGRALGLISLSGRAQSSSAQTRWHCRAKPGGGLSEPVRWQWEKVKDRAGQTGHWQVEWKDQAHAPDYGFMAAAASA